MSVRVPRSRMLAGVAVLTVAWHPAGAQTPNSTLSSALSEHRSEHFAFGGYFANSEWASKNTDIVKKFVRATYDAGRYTNAHHGETAAMMADITKIPLPVMQKIARAEAATSSDPALLQPLIDVAAKYKQIPRSFPAKEIYFGG